MPMLWNINPLLFVAVFVVFTLLLFYFLEHGLKRKDRLEVQKRKISQYDSPEKTILTADSHGFFAFFNSFC